MSVMAQTDPYSRDPVRRVCELAADWYGALDSHVLVRLLGLDEAVADAQAEAERRGEVEGGEGEEKGQAEVQGEVEAEPEWPYRPDLGTESAPTPLQALRRVRGFEADVRAREALLTATLGSRGQRPTKYAGTDTHAGGEASGKEITRREWD